MANRALLLAFAAAVQAQWPGTIVQENHPKLNWQRCQSDNSCETVNGEIVMDAEWRWIQSAGGFSSCYRGNEWDSMVCDGSGEECAKRCSVEGEEYDLNTGIKTDDDAISLQYVKPTEYDDTINARVFLLEEEDQYQMFTLLDNELAFDIDLSALPCGLNGALKFVAMEADGGMASYPTNRAGAKFGTGYCDASCPRENKFVGGKANNEGWQPSISDDFGGMGRKGPCCSEFDIWNSNAYSYSMSTKICKNHEYHVCDGAECDLTKVRNPPITLPNCDKYGCDFSPYRLGNTEFFGKNKAVDTTEKFTVVTRFEEAKVTQFFIQNGNRIDPPTPVFEGFPDDNGLTRDFCRAKHVSFEERNLFEEVGGWSGHLQALQTPMVLTMLITDDHWSHNLWLDSLYPLEGQRHLPGRLRGDCSVMDGDPLYLQKYHGSSTVAWSNIRFGPIGSTVDV